jgi:hypothetical protein
MGVRLAMERLHRPTVRVRGSSDVLIVCRRGDRQVETGVPIKALVRAMGMLRVIAAKHLTAMISGTPPGWTTTRGPSPS